MPATARALPSSCSTCASNASRPARVRNTSQLFGLLTEIIFILAGTLLLFVGLTGRYLFDARRPSWLVLAAILIFWGLRSWRRARLVAVRGLRLAARLGGVSLMLVGAIMLSLAWVRFGWVGPLLAVAGAVFVLRGLLTAAILAFAS
jgi:uncharacterized iron-regulated membrane protein